MELSRNGIYRETLRSLNILKYYWYPFSTPRELSRDHSYWKSQISNELATDLEKKSSNNIFLHSPLHFDKNNHEDKHHFKGQILT